MTIVLIILLLFNANSKEITILDIAEIFVGGSTGITTVRVILSLWRAMRTIAQLFAESNDEGILVAESCIFKPKQDTECEGGAL